jgi:osmotically-inducible protein OsmY
MDKTSQESAAFDRDSPAPQVDLRALALRIKRTVRRETNGRVQDLNVRIDPGGIVLQGKCGSFYCKQLAQTAAMRLGGGASVINEIEVAETSRENHVVDPGAQTRRESRE